MKLYKDLTSKGVRVVCAQCATTHEMKDVWADLDGRAFIGYYCDTCAEDYPQAPKFVRGQNNGQAVVE